ncbi:MAG: FAD-dependent oxidoreductase [Actinocatenispora sp.]
MTRSGEVSWWYRTSGLPTYRPALPGDRQVDIAIVGAGFTGLWCAYYLKRAQPDLRIAVLEREFAGFGASGRNGGWLSGLLPGPRRRYARHGGVAATCRLQRAVIDGIAEVVDVTRRESIDAGLVAGGRLEVATNAAQLRRLREVLREDREFGLGQDDVRLLTSDELDSRIRVAGSRGALYSTHGARIQPAALVRGLAAAVERAGVDIYERTEVTRIRPGAAECRPGTVRAEVVLRATEGFTASLAGHRRDLLSMNSVMIATEPLPPRFWATVGWQGAELLADAAHAFSYAQRTADDRIAIGGRGVPYRYGSRTDHWGQARRRDVVALWRVLTGFFPDLAADTAVTHAWCGVLGVSRDWSASAGLDRRTGLGWAGGYVGDGVTMSNLAGRTLRDLVLGRDTALTGLPWVNRPGRRWEPEPARYLGVRTVYGLYRVADRFERRDRRVARAVTAVADVIAGR